MGQEVLQPVWGQKICDRRGWAFADVFRHQFRISRARSIVDWPAHNIGAFRVEHCPHLPTTLIMNRQGAEIGVLLGVAVDADGAAYGSGDGAVLTMSASFAAVERHQARMAGRFAMLVKIGNEVRFYPDASSSLTTVLNARAGVLAASVPLAIDTPVRPTTGGVDDLWRASRLRLMGETSDRRVTQLYANHYVDLSDFAPHRFWPDAATSFDPPGQDAIEPIAERLRAIMGVFVNRFACALPVTGGKDSRLLAAALTPDAMRRMRHFFVYEINWSTGFDVTSAKAVAAHLGLPLDVKRVSSGDCAAELADLDLRVVRAQTALATGFAHPRLGKTVLQAMHVTPPCTLLLRGGAAELVHANKWPQPPRIPARVEAEFAFERLAGQSTTALRRTLGDDGFKRSWSRYNDWFHGLPQGAQARAPDVGHRELWLSGPFGTIFQAPRRHFYVNPFNDYRLMTETTRFDPKIRRRGVLLKSLLDHLSPGLAEVPYATQLRAKMQAA